MVRKTLIAAAVAVIPLTSMGLVEKADAGYYVYYRTCHLYYSPYSGIVWRVCG